MKVRVPSIAALPALLLAGLAGCGDQGRGQDEYPVALAQGTYRVAFGQGYPVEDEARLLAVTAHLDRATNQIAFDLADGSRQVLAFTPRPTSQWQPDCFTMSSHSLDEVADLSPAPLRLESLSFATPLVYAKCTPARMILANAAGEASTFLAFDLE